MHTLWQDLRYAGRMLARSPGFTIAAVLTLALGIGANSAIFSVVNAVLLRPLPYKDPDRLVMVWATNLKRGYQRDVSSYPQFLEWKQRNHVFEDLAAGAGLGANLTGVDVPERLFGWRMTSNLFALLGAQPALGRSFSTDEEQPGKNRVVILSDGLWRRRFAADPRVLGRTMQLNGESYSVIGVMPASFRFPPGDSVLPFDLWVPLHQRTGGVTVTCR